MGSGRIVGAILSAIGAIILVLAVLWLGANAGEGKAQTSGLIFGFGFFAIIALAFLAPGVYMIVKGQGEVKEFAEIEKEKRLLNMVMTQGKVQLANAAVEMNLGIDQIKAYVYDLVGKGLFTGYVDWKSNTLFSTDASKVGTTTCPNCGGQRELVGKGIVKCPFCGAEIFLPPSA
jgi:hypothetical protein